MCDITCTKHFLGSEGWDATPLFLFIHSSSCPPPPTLPFPPTRNAMPTEIKRPNSSPKFPTSNWRCTRTHENYGFPSDLKIPNAKYMPSIIYKQGDPNLGGRLFPEVKLFSALHKTDTTLHMFASNMVFWYHYHQCSETFPIPTVSQNMASCKLQDDQQKVHKIVRKSSASLFMHKVYMLVWFGHTNLDHIESLASPLLPFNTRPVWRL